MTPGKRANPPRDEDVPGFRVLAFPGHDLLQMKLGLAAIVDAILDIDKANGHALDWGAVTSLSKALSDFAAKQSPIPRRFDVIAACIGVAASAFDAIEEEAKDPLAVIEHKEGP